MSLFETLSKAIKPQEVFERPDAFEYREWTCIPDNDYFIAGAFINRTDWTVYRPDGKVINMVFSSAPNLKLFIDHQIDTNGKKN